MAYGRLALYINNVLFTYNTSTESTVNNCSVGITPGKIDISKAIGRHNTIDVCLKVEAKNGGTLTLSDLKTHFMDKSVKIQLQNQESGNWVDKYAVAENYRVMEVRPELTLNASTTFYVNLLIFSSDVLMDMTPYSRAYTARKLGGDILAGIVSKYDDLKSACDVSGLRVLKYVSSAVNVELRLPYVVQYNETEYDFILRNANRCGEFLYFENGKLILGLPDPVSVPEVSEYASIESVASGSPKDSAVAYAHGAVHDSGTPGDKTYLAEYANDDWFSVIQKDCYDTANDRKGELNPPNWSRIVSQVFQYVNLSTSIIDIGFSEASLQNLCAGLADDDNHRISGKCFYYSECFGKEKKGNAEEEKKNRYGKDEEKEWKKIKKLCKKDKDPAYLAEDAKWQYAKSGKTWLHTQFSDFYTTKGNDSGCAIPDSKSDKIDSKTEQNSLKGTIPSDKRPITAAFYEMLKKEKEAERQQYRITFNSSCHGYRLGDIVKVSAIDANARFVVVAVESELHEEKKTVVTTTRTETEVKTETSVRTETVSTMTVTVIPTDYTAATASAGESYKPVPLPADTEVVRRVGSMTAVVTDSEDPLRLGRVRVRFHWQKATDDATPWIRVATPFATKDDSGMQFNLVKDDEVMVGFESENVERPYVIGALYNSTNTPPFGQRNYSMVMRSRNGQTIAFKDTANSATILTSVIPGLKFLKFIPPIATMSIDSSGNLKTRRGMGQIDITDYYGLYTISGSSDQRSIKIESPFGTVSMSAAMGITISAPNGNVKIIGKNVDIVSGNNLTLKSGTNIDEALISSAISSINGKSGGPLGKAAKQEAKAIVNKLAGVFDLPALRFALELAIKPVAGTLKIHSGRYLMLEAGNSNAVIPPSAFDRDPQKYDGTVYGNRYGDLTSLARRIEQFIAYMKAYKAAYTNEYKRIHGMRAAVQEEISKDVIQGLKVEDYVTGCLTAPDNNLEPLEVFKKLYDPDATADTMNQRENRAKKKKATGLSEQLKALKAAVTDFKGNGTGRRKWEPEVYDDLTGKQTFNALEIARKMAGYFVENPADNLKNFILTGEDDDQIIVTDNINANYMRKNAINCINEFKATGITFSTPPPEVRDGLCDVMGANVADAAFTGQWAANLQNLVMTGNTEDHWFRDSWRDAGINIFRGLTSYDSFTNSVAWKLDSAGSILMAEKKDSTKRFDGNVLKEEHHALDILIKALEQVKSLNE